MATEYRNNAKLNVVTRRWREHFPTPPSPSLPPALQPPIALPIFSRSSAVGSRSRIKPLIEMRLEAFEHLFFYVFDVGEQLPTSDIAVFTGALKLQNEFFH
jgi:hypothetical protein